MSEVVIMVDVTRRIDFLLDQGVIPDFVHYPEYEEQDQLRLIENLSQETPIIIPFNETLIMHSVQTGKKKVIVVTECTKKRFKARQMGVSIACSADGLPYAYQLLHSNSTS